MCSQFFFACIVTQAVGDNALGLIFFVVGASQQPRGPSLFLQAMGYKKQPSSTSTSIGTSSSGSSSSAW